MSTIANASTARQTSGLVSRRSVVYRALYGAGDGNRTRNQQLGRLSFDNNDRVFEHNETFSSITKHQ
jgi:hypothetical protein